MNWGHVRGHDEGDGFTLIETNREPSGVIAGVLIGGQSRRMGTCKALLPYQGTALVDCVVSAARTVADDVILLGNAELSTPGSMGLLRLADEPNSGGPLAGLVPLLEHAGDRWAMLIACDMPLIQSGILRRLLDGRDATVDAVAFQVSNGGDESFPCCALFHPRVIRAARTELAQSRGLQALLARVRCRVLRTDAGEAHCLRSFNTPLEYGELIDSGDNVEETGTSPE